MSFLPFIEGCLKTTSVIALKGFGKVKASVKPEDNNQVLTEIDLAIGEYIIDRIQNKYPTYNIIDEEKGVINNGSEYTWVIDPIDGTSNYAAGVPLYGTFLGLLKEGDPYAGGMCLPHFSDIYLAEKGEGTSLNRERVRVTREVNLNKTLVSYTIDSHTENPTYTKKETEILANIILNIRNPRMSGSCFDVAMVAKGCYGAYLNQTSKIWDNVAAQIIIEEAGGIYTDFYGEEMDYSQPLEKLKNNYTFCAASPQIHGQLQDIIQKFK